MSSRNESFCSSSSETKQTSRHAQKFSILQEVNSELDKDGDSLEIEAPPSPNKQQGDGGASAAARPKTGRRLSSFFTSSTKLKSSESMGTPGLAKRFLRKTKSDRYREANNASQSSSSLFGWHGANSFNSFRKGEDESEGASGSSGLSTLLSPRSADQGGTLSHITSIFHSSLTSLKRGLDTQASGSIDYSSSEEHEA
jgi:hypothetical protein